MTSWWEWSWERTREVLVCRTQEIAEVRRFHLLFSLSRMVEVQSVFKSPKAYTDVDRCLVYDWASVSEKWAKKKMNFSINDSGAIGYPHGKQEIKVLAHNCQSQGDSSCIEDYLWKPKSQSCWETIQRGSSSVLVWGKTHKGKESARSLRSLVCWRSKKMSHKIIAFTNNYERLTWIISRELLKINKKKGNNLLE